MQIYRVTSLYTTRATNAEEVMEDLGGNLLLKPYHHICDVEEVFPPEVFAKIVRVAVFLAKLEDLEPVAKDKMLIAYTKYLGYSIEDEEGLFLAMTSWGEWLSEYDNDELEDWLE